MVIFELWYKSRNATSSNTGSEFLTPAITKSLIGKGF